MKSRGREIMVPFVSAIVPEVDVAAGTITVTPPPGLFEELPESDVRMPRPLPMSRLQRMPRPWLLRAMSPGPASTRHPDSRDAPAE